LISISSFKLTLTILISSFGIRITSFGWSTWQNFSNLSFPTSEHRMSAVLKTFSELDPDQTPILFPQSITLTQKEPLSSGTRQSAERRTAETSHNPVAAQGKSHV
jgi:hypothetical protein